MKFEDYIFPVSASLMVLIAIWVGALSYAGNGKHHSHATKPAPSEQDGLHKINFVQAPMSERGPDDIRIDINDDPDNATTVNQVPDANMQEAIYKAAARTGVNPDLLVAVCMAESGCVPSTGNPTVNGRTASKAKGPWQIIPTTWRAAKRDAHAQGLIDNTQLKDDRNHPGTSTAVAATELDRIIKAARQSTRTVTFGDVYAYWVLGDGTAEKLKRRPTTYVDAMMPYGAVAGNPTLFCGRKLSNATRIGRKSHCTAIGRAPITAEAALQKIHRRLKDPDRQV